MGILSLLLAASLSGPWTGTYSLGGSAQVAFDISGKRALVALGVGHAGLQSVPLSTGKGRVVFRLPGAPAPLTFSGRLVGGRIRGSVRQGKAHGTFHVRRGRAPSLVAPGIYAGGGRTLAVVDDPYGPARLVDLDTGGLHGLYPSGSGFVIGSGWRTRAPTKGTARFAASSAVIDGNSFARLPLRQLEVRFPSGRVTLSGTLTVPPGAGPHRAVAWVHGSGRTVRAYLPDLEAVLLHQGVAVLAYDKRGVGQSGGSYPGESPNPLTIDTLARDAEAAVRFLRTRPEIDHDRIGLAGHSQAGWIIPLAASRAPAIRFAVIFSGPAVTADENDHYQTLTGEGETLSTLSEQEIDARVLADGPGGVDPIPWIAALHIPVLWAYGGLDQHVPPRLSARRLAPLVAEPGRHFTVETFPHANHALVETQTGLTSEMLRSDTFAPGLFASIGDWIGRTIPARWLAPFAYP
jgi:dienelactone hydrolase